MLPKTHLDSLRGGVSGWARAPGVCCVKMVDLWKNQLEMYHNRVDFLVSLPSNRIIDISSNHERPQSNDKDTVIINLVQMLRAAYNTSGGMSSQKFCCCRIHFLQYLVIIFSIPRDGSFPFSFPCKFFLIFVLHFSIFSYIITARESLTCSQTPICIVPLP